MSSLKLNIIANYGGRFSSAAINIICVPLYLKFMGVESYGLVGFLLTLQSVFSIFEAGVTTTANRELARLSELKESEGQIRDFIRTFELLYWIFSVMAAVTIYICAPVLAAHWLKSEHLSVTVLENAIIAMGILIALEGPSALYSGSLMGLEEQVLKNCIDTVFVVIKCFGAVAVLWLVSPTVEAYLLWQIPVAAGKIVITAFYLNRALPKTGRRPRFDMAYLFSVGRFTIGVMGSTVLVVLLTQGDKILLSKLLTLEMFGYYNLASVLSSNLVGTLGDPIRHAIFPRFSKLVELRNFNKIASLYHFVCQAVSVALLPVSAIVTLFAYEILRTWTGNEVTAQNTYEILRLLIIAWCLRVIMSTPATLQLAYGWTRLIVGLNGASLLFFIPAIYIFTAWDGPVGAGMAWVLVSAAYTICGVAIMHRHILKGEQWRWYSNDAGVPFLAAFGVGWFFRLMAPVEMSTTSVCCYLALALISSMAITAITCPLIRHQLRCYRLSAVPGDEQATQNGLTEELPKR